MLYIFNNANELHSTCTVSELRGCREGGARARWLKHILLQCGSSVVLALHTFHLDCTLGNYIIFLNKSMIFFSRVVLLFWTSTEFTFRSQDSSMFVLTIYSLYVNVSHLLIVLWCSHFSPCLCLHFSHLFPQLLGYRGTSKACFVSTICSMFINRESRCLNSTI